MAESTDSRSGASLRLWQTLEAVVYALAVAGILVGVAVVVSFPVGFGWVGVKFVLFFVGFLLFGIAALQLRPKPPWKQGEEVQTEREETRFEGFVQRLPPLRGNDLPTDQRLSPATKLFVASVLTLVISFLMEAVLGVGR